MADLSVRPPKIVVLGGGTGSFTLLQALKKLTPHITAIVSMSDDGGSSGALRDELGVLPPGDARQCLVALSDSPEIRNLFNYRFSEGRLEGQSLGNIILSGLELQHGSFEKAVLVASKVLRIRGTVLPVTLGNHRLIMHDADQVIRGEHLIDEHSVTSRQATVRLEPAATLNPAAHKAIRQADMVVIAPGSLYSSLLPIFAVGGMAEALARTTATVVSVINLVNKPGQTDGWHVADFVAEQERYLGSGQIDVVLYNNQPIAEELLQKYAAEGEFPVRTEKAKFKSVSAQLVGARLVAPEISAQDPADQAIKRTLIRHDASEVSKQLLKLLAT